MRPLNAVYAACAAADHGVTVEHLRATIKARRLYRAAERDRRRHRVSQRGRRLIVFGRDSSKHLARGEGELHGLLKLVGMTKAEFCELAGGIAISTFDRWYGHPLHAWPLVVLRQYAELKAMREYLRERGVPLEQFAPKALPPMPPPKFPRRVSDVEIVGEKKKAEYSPWKMPKP